MVFSSKWTLRRFFFAASMPLRIADGTSFALPTPKPTTRAEESPTTTSAEKLIFLPPLTTLVTRLIATTFSFRFSDCGSTRFTVTAGMTTPVLLALKLQPRFAGRIGQRLDTAMIKIAAAIEYHSVDALGFGAFGHPLADFLRRRHIAAGFGGLEMLLDRACGHHGDALRIVDYLRVDMSHAAEHG